MALRKNKIELIDNSNSLRIALDQWCDDEQFNYYDDDYDCNYWDWNPGCTCHSCLGCNEYTYADGVSWDNTFINENAKILSKRGSVWVSSKPMILGKLIDMNSIYSKEVRREKKIDEILGLTTKNPTIGDIWNPMKK